MLSFMAFCMIAFVILRLYVDILIKKGYDNSLMKFMQKLFFITIIITFINCLIIKFFNINNDIILILYNIFLIISIIIIVSKLIKIKNKMQ